ncbi:hypothetical protein FCI23_52745 [Actinacidiphila oryziradicis]|uniref:Uncharacterized protein n=1 Tax=Actinacidiphila oryziradicis TaxID=2571141 RepID=A0A4U0RIB2_9ACTN|nr:hypothetical protein FCI23_52745 [Actinacidiphila oryziradicis]
MRNDLLRRGDAGQLRLGIRQLLDTGVSVTAPALSGRVTALGSAGQDCVGHGSFVAGDHAR